MNIKPFDRLSFQVESQSRPGQHHIVDLEAMVCTCEGFGFTGNCQHMEAVLSLSTVAIQPAEENINPLELFL